MRLEGSAFFKTGSLLQTRPFRLWLLLLMGAIIAWIVWFLFAPLPIKETSQSAVFSSGESITALFSPDTALKLETNQPAEIRLDQFPWREFGSGAGIVVQNDSQIRNEFVEVDILYRSGLESLPLQRGLTAEIIVTVEEITPAELLWRRLVERTAGE